jgi:heat-inducible transcriptional repressor
MPILTELNEIIEEISRAVLELGGESNIFSVCDNDRDARDILSIFNHKEALVSMLAEATEPLNLLFGSEMSFAKRSPSTLIVTSYNNGNGNFGRIGVIGPERIEYKEIIPSLSYVAKKTGDIMREAIKDMED